MSKSNPSRPAMFLPSRFSLAPPRQDRFEMRPQIGVLRPQIHDAVPSADDSGADGHSFKHQVGEVGQDDAVLESAGFALVGIADDVFLFAGRFGGHAATSGWSESPRRRGPADRTGRPRPALPPAPSPRRPANRFRARWKKTSTNWFASDWSWLWLLHWRPGHCRQTFAGTAPECRGPSPGSLACNHLVVDQHRRSLIAHPQAIRPAERKLAVRRGLARSGCRGRSQAVGRCATCRPCRR